MLAFRTKEMVEEERRGAPHNDEFNWTPTRGGKIRCEEAQPGDDNIRTRGARGFGSFVTQANYFIKDQPRVKARTRGYTSMP